MATIYAAINSPAALKENGLDSLDICPQGKEKINSLLAALVRSKLSKQITGDRLPTDDTDKHGNAGDEVNDNGDKLRPNQLPGALNGNNTEPLERY